MQIPLANPQTLDSFGRTTNKIWVPGRYSILVENSNNVEKYQELDAGETAESGITSLTNVQGANTITAEGVPTITAYVDKETYIFKIVNAPTGAVTLNIDNVGAKSIVKDSGQPIINSDVLANQIWAVTFNSTNDNFELQSSTSNVVDFYEGTAIASAATTDIWATDGNTIHVTGTTACTSFGTAPNVGARRRLIYDSAVTLTNSTNLHLQGEADFTTEAGDILDVYADTTSQFDVIIHPVDGQAVIGSANLALSNLSDAGNDKISKAWVNFNGTGTVAIRDDFNVSSITDNATGDYTVNYTTNLPDANYSSAGSSESNDATGRLLWMHPTVSRTVSAIRVQTGAPAGSQDAQVLQDSEVASVIIF